MPPRSAATAVAVVVAAALLVGCTSTADPDPSTSAPATDASPATLEELATALIDEGLVDDARLEISDPPSDDPESLHLDLRWETLPARGEQLAALAEVQARIDDVLDERPDVTRIVLSGGLPGGGGAVVDVEVDPGRDTLGELLDVVMTTECSEATGFLLDEVLSDGGGTQALVVQLDCAVEGDDAVDLAVQYDAITAIAPTSPVVGETHWAVRLEGGGNGIHPRLQLEAPPVDGRQQLLVDLMTTAVDAGGEALGISDYGFRLDVHGLLPAGSETTCQTLDDRMVAAGVERRTVSFDVVGAPEDAAVNLCFLQS